LVCPMAEQYSDGALMKTGTPLGMPGSRADSRNAEGFMDRGTFNSLAMGNVMQAAARNIKKEMRDEQADYLRALELENSRGVDIRNLKINDDDAEDELAKLHETRLQQLKEASEKRQVMKVKGHGQYEIIAQDDFLDAVTQSDHVIVHFYHDEFERCKIIDKHLKALCPRYFDTRFVRLSAPDSPFFVKKLNVQMLPCIVFFHKGVAYDRIVGFEEFGGKDDFKTSVLEERLQNAGAIKPRDLGGGSDDDADDNEDERREMANRARSSVRAGGRRGKVDSDDEDSDFSD